MASTALILHFIPFGFMLFVWWGLSFILSYLIFGADTLKSMRWLHYQLRWERQTANHKDTFYLGDEFYKVEPFKDVVTPEAENKIQDPSNT